MMRSDPKSHSWQHSRIRWGARFHLQRIHTCKEASPSNVKVATTLSFAQDVNNLILVGEKKEKGNKS